MKMSIYKCGFKFPDKYRLISFHPCAAYMRQWIGWALVPKMVCRLFDAKPLCHPMLIYCQLDHKKQTSVTLYLNYKDFHSRWCIRKHRLLNGGHFVPEFPGQSMISGVSSREQVQTHKYASNVFGGYVGEIYWYFYRCTFWTRGRADNFGECNIRGVLDSWKYF